MRYRPQKREMVEKVSEIVAEAYDLPIETIIGDIVGKSNPFILTSIKNQFVKSILILQNISTFKKNSSTY